MAPSEARNRYFGKALVLAAAQKAHEEAGVAVGRAQKEVDLTWNEARAEAQSEGGVVDEEGAAAEATGDPAGEGADGSAEGGAE